MVRYEPPSLASRCLLPFYRGVRRPFKPKIVRLLVSVLFWIFMFGWMVTCSYLARYPKDMAVLPDILFNILPEHSISPLPDILLFVLLTSVIGRIIFHSEGAAIARRFLAISGCIYFFRGITLVATSFPNPKLQCEDYTHVWSLSGLLLPSCSDAIGHPVHLALAALCWSQYSKHMVVGAVAWMIAVAGMITLIVSRSYYTIEILLSVFISVFIWKYYHISLSLPSDRWNTVVMWLEKLDFGAATEDQGRETPNFGGSVLVSSSSSMYKELEAGSPENSKFKDMGASAAPTTRFIELTESLGVSTDSAYKELPRFADE